MDYSTWYEGMLLRRAQSVTLTDEYHNPNLYILTRWHESVENAIHYRRWKNGKAFGATAAAYANSFEPAEPPQPFVL